MNDWQRFCGRAPTNIEAEHWASLADTAIGIALGFNDIVAVDIDTNDKAIIAALRGCLPYTPAIKRGAKGETLFFRGKAAPRSYNIGGRRVCDLLGYGRQSVLPPSVHPDTGAAIYLDRRKGPRRLYTRMNCRNCPITWRN